MANVKEIQDRIKSIQDTMKITNAMYMISSIKMKKAKKALSDTEPYFFFEMQSAIRVSCVMCRILSMLSSNERPKLKKTGKSVTSS